MSTERSFLGTLSILLASFLIAYVPLTHRSHMFMKYFIYHGVRWEDTPNLRGSRIEAAIIRNLGCPHMGADGKKTWEEIAGPGRKEGQ